MTTLQSIIENNIATCENPANRIITECEFYATEDSLEVWIRSDYSGWCEDVKCLYTFGYVDVSCCTFTSNDFIGLTETQATSMIQMSLIDDVLFCLENDNECLPF